MDLRTEHECLTHEIAALERLAFEGETAVGAELFRRGDIGPAVALVSLPLVAVLDALHSRLAAVEEILAGPASERWPRGCGG